MARYKIQTHQGLTYGLKKGETAEQLAEQLQDVTLFGFLDNVGEVKGDYLVSALPWGLVRRNSNKRRHRKRGFIRGTRTALPRLETEPEVPRPRFGKGSGRSGGARAATHKRSHLKFAPDTKPEECYICQRGLAQAKRYQREQFFDTRKDKTLEPLDELPEDLREAFSDPLDHREFIERWKRLEDRVKLRFLRFMKYLDKRWRSKQQQWVAEREHREAAERASRAEDVEL